MSNLMPEKMIQMQELTLQDIEAESLFFKLHVMENLFFHPMCCYLICPVVLSLSPLLFNFLSFLRLCVMEKFKY